MSMITYHSEDCDSDRCEGECHEGELECNECGEIWEGEWDDAPVACESCGEPFNHCESDESLRNAERKQMGIT